MPSKPASERDPSTKKTAKDVKITPSHLSNTFKARQDSKSSAPEDKTTAIAQALSANNPEQSQGNEARFANCLVIGLTYALGTQQEPLIEQLAQAFELYGYAQTHWLNIADFLAEEDSNGPKPWWLTLGLTQDQIKRQIKTDKKSGIEKETFKMRAGTELRKKYGPSILSELALAELCQGEHGLKDSLTKRRLFIITSFKQPDEIRLLKTVLGNHFFFIALYEDEKAREIAFQDTERGERNEEQIKALMETDQDQKQVKNGQKLADTFALADYIMAASNDPELIKDQIQRCLKVLFGYPFVTPTLDEQCQYLAYCASLKSSDLARQVGAVIVKDHNLLAMGANEPPQFGGGTYWPIPLHGLVSEHPRGRDFMRCDDSNITYQNMITDSIQEALKDKDCNCKDSEQECKPCKDRKRLIQDALKPWITEYGRSVHAEMDAICSAARMGIALAGATLYTTTYPCHNCARHIITAGIRRVVFVEPYPKSRALELHDDALYLQGQEGQGQSKLCLEHFTGVCPQAFAHYFGINHPELGRSLDRKAVFERLKDQGEERLKREKLSKTLQQLPKPQGDKNAAAANTEENIEALLDPPGKNSTCASKHFYQLWQQQSPKPTLRFRELTQVLHARLALFIEITRNPPSG